MVKKKKGLKKKNKQKKVINVFVTFIVCPQTNEDIQMKEIDIEDLDDMKLGLSLEDLFNFNEDLIFKNIKKKRNDC